MGCAALLALVPGAQAQRNNRFSTSIDFMAGVSNQAGSAGYNLSALQKGVVPTYSVYPSLSLKSTGEHSSLDLNYTFGADRTQMSPSITMTSHAATAGFTTQLAKGVRLNFTDTFLTTSDFSTINLLKGFIVSPEGFQYVFEPQLYRRTSISDTANAALAVDLNKQSSLTFAASGSYLHYTRDAFASGFLFDQMRVEGDISYSYRRGAHQIMSTKYAVYQNDIKDYANIRSHAMTFGLSQELSPSLRLSFEVGPSFTESTGLQKEYFGYVASVYAVKVLHSNRFSLNYSRRSGDSTGLGGTSDSHQGGLGFSRGLTRTTTIGFDASVFGQRQGSTSLYNFWGIRGSMTLSQSVGEHWVVSLGGSYQTYQGQAESMSNLEYKRAFVSFGYRLPGMRRTTR